MGPGPSIRATRSGRECGCQLSAHARASLAIDLDVCSKCFYLFHRFRLSASAQLWLLPARLPRGHSALSDPPKPTSVGRIPRTLRYLAPFLQQRRRPADVCGRPALDLLGEDHASATRRWWLWLNVMAGVLRGCSPPSVAFMDVLGTATKGESIAPVHSKDQDESRARSRTSSEPDRPESAVQQRPALRARQKQDPSSGGLLCHETEDASVRRRR
jgi:hypothetical protein